MNPKQAYRLWNLPTDIRSRFVDNGNGCLLHVLEAGRTDAPRGCILLLHGFPELAFSWRKQLLPLAEAGFHVVAPDLRGFGESCGTDVRFDDDLRTFSMLNRVADIVGLVLALGHQDVAAIVGHDFGAHVAGWCALIRPDVFRSVAFMSATFPGPPELSLGEDEPVGAGPVGAIRDLEKLPRPRKHYWSYFASREANAQMTTCPQGVHAFLRAYFHIKSGYWEGNQPHPLNGWVASELAKLPVYYVMDIDKDMPQSVAWAMPSDDEIEACEWLPESDLRVYSEQFRRTGFQGGLQVYRVIVGADLAGEMNAFSGRTVDVPACFISGDRDWGSHQVPLALSQMQARLCTQMCAPQFVSGAGHWVQQEAPGQVVELLLDFVGSIRS